MQLEKGSILYCVAHANRITTPVVVTSVTKTRAKLSNGHKVNRNGAVDFELIGMSGVFYRIFDEAAEKQYNQQELAKLVNAFFRKLEKKSFEERLNAYNKLNNIQ